MREKTWLLCGAACVMTAATASAAFAAALPEVRTPYMDGTLIIPGSSQSSPQDRGVRAHTNFQIFEPKGIHNDAAAPSGRYETPASVACVYGVTAYVAGCNPSTLTTVTTGGSKAIAIVDAYDYPTATADLAVFSKQFGLPAPSAKNFKVVYAGGTKPAQDSSGGWEAEEALDIEMAHALAPGALVLLVEANSNSTADLFAAEKVAATMVAAAGGGEISNSWSGGESPGEKKFESTFQKKGVVFLASAGDSSGIGVPAALMSVIAVGGTTINRNQNTFNFISQTSWGASGGGSSAYILRPAYQKPVSKLVGTYRGTPDISLVANPGTGVWLYDTTAYNGRVLDWAVFGGTSVSSPLLAAILNNAGSFAGSTAKELTMVYKGFTDTANWTDITAGSCGNNGGATAVAGWDFCTGVGVPNGLAGK